MKTYLVTGGLGFIGSHIAEALVKRGDRVRILDDLSTGNRANIASIASQVEVVVGSVTDGVAVDRAVEGVDVVFHEAALASVPRSLVAPLDTHAVCVTGTLNVLDAARRLGTKRVVYAASSSAYGNPPNDRAKSESDLPLPLSPYAAAKLSAEHYCRAFFESFGLDTVCLRYFNVFGPRQDPNGPYAAVIPKFITAMKCGTPPTIFGDGLQARDFTYIENVVSANLLAAETKAGVGKVFNVGAGTTTNLLELVELLNQALGTKIRPNFEPARIGDVRVSLADMSQSRSVLGIETQVDLKEGINRTVAAMKDSK